MSPSMNEAKRDAVARQLGRRPWLSSRSRRTLWLAPDGWLDPASGERWSAVEALPDSVEWDLVLSEHLLFPLVADGDLVLHGSEDMRNHAAQLLSHYHGAHAQSWPLAVWCEGQGEQRRYGAWALSSRESQDVWRVLRPRLRSARPAALVCLDACRQQEPQWAQAPHAALAWVEGSLLCWLELQAGVLYRVRHVRLAAPGREALRQRLHALQQDLPPDTGMLLAGHGLSDEWTDDLAPWRCLTPMNAGLPPALLWERPAPAPAEARGDFLPPVAPLARWRWPLLGVALLCLALAAQEGWQAHLQWQAARDDLAAQQARQSRRAAPTAAALRTGTLPAPRDHKALLEARQALQQPWQTVLTQVEAAALDEAQRPRVAWLALDLQAARGELRLEGQAEDRAQILAVADALSRLPGWHEVLPGAIQTEEGGRTGMRFTLQARLAAHALAAPPPSRPTSGVLP